MNKSKKIIIIMIIVTTAILLLIALLLNLLKNKKNPEQFATENISQNKVTPITQNTIDQQIDILTLFKINNCISTYLDDINKNNTAYFGEGPNGTMVKTVDDKTIETKILNLLNKDYIDKNNIQLSNVYQFVDNINENVLFNTLDIKEYKNTNQYFVYGTIQDLDNKFIKKAYYIININSTDNCFSIQPILKDNVDFNNVNFESATVNKNEDNEILAAQVTSEDICRQYMNTYKRLMLSSPDIAYQYLDNTYKQKRFTGLDDFKNYINTNISRISQIQLQKYNVTNQNNNDEYVCIDQDGNYYIFNATSILNYTVMLDSYTVDIPEFTDKYSNAVDTEKVAMNIEKIREAINLKDYKYVYNKLDDTFRNNNFPTQDKMENYLKTNLFNTNNFKNINIDNQNGAYLFTLKVTDANNSDNNATSKSMNMVIKLQEGTNFVMSFSMQ